MNNAGVNPQSEVNNIDATFSFENNSVFNSIDVPTIAVNVTRLQEAPTPPASIEDHPNLSLLPLRDCGPASSPRIAFGKPAELREFPWMALLRYRDIDGSLSFRCGGTIINDQYILTAAHCITNSLYSVIIGEHDTETDLDCETISNSTTCNPPAEEILVGEPTPHPLYVKATSANDIGLLRLARKITFKDHIQPVCLPVTEELKAMPLRKLQLSGWGANENNTFSMSPQLLTAVLDAKDISYCRTTFKTERLNENQICAQGNGTIDACRGDSGGPLVTVANLNSAKTIQFGVVSIGVSSCGVGDLPRPGIYTRVQRYVEWILDNISE